MKLGLILMASGYSVRFGSNKLFYQINGLPMYLYGIQMIQDLLIHQEEEVKLHRKEPVMIQAVVVSQYEEILKAARAAHLTAVYNPDSIQGITSSIHLGLNFCDDDCSDFMFIVADQPFLTAASVTRFITGYKESQLPLGCVSCEGHNGNPTIFSARWKKELYQLTNDRGGSRIIKEHPMLVYRFQINAKEIRDIDTPEDVKIIGV